VRAVHAATYMICITSAPRCLANHPCTYTHPYVSIHRSGRASHVHTRSDAGRCLTAAPAPITGMPHAGSMGAWQVTSNEPQRSSRSRERNRLPAGGAASPGTQYPGTRRPAASKPAYAAGHRWPAPLATTGAPQRVPCRG
jgi:hypothetical protein